MSKARKPKPQKVIAPFDGRPTVEERQAAWREMYTAADRAAALLAAAQLDMLLEDVLVLRMIELSEDEFKNIFRQDGAPLKNFGAKMRVAHAFGAYGPITLGDLKVIGKIRNNFAHSPRAIGFESPEISRLCATLKVPEAYAERKVLEQLKIEYFYEWAAPGDPQSVRWQFLVTTEMISLCLDTEAVSTYGTRNMVAALKEQRPGPLSRLSILP